MFYSETLLAKTGPLAKVWLAANLERKLNKQNVLSSNLENNVKDIIGQGQAPMALRLSGQLLLGVVKIYKRKTLYLVDDASEALHKIRVAFRPGNVDLPAHQSHAANPNTLILPDAVTELDLFAPLPDPEDFLRDDFDRRAPGQDPTLLDFGTSQLLSQSQTPSRREKHSLALDDIDLDLDYGLEPGEGPIGATPFSAERSIEVGRRAQTPRRDDPTMLDDLDLGLDFGADGDTTIGGAAFANNDVPMIDGDDGYQVMDGDDTALPSKHAVAGRPQGAAEGRHRDSASLLSDIRASAERDLEQSYRLNHTNGDQDDSTTVQAAQRVKRRKVMQPDTETQLHQKQIKEQQEDRSAITKAPTFLSRDPLLLQLMEMQRNGSFVSNIMGDGRMTGWAPELRGILSLEFVRKAGEKKRKRDSGIADIDIGSERQETPQLDLPLDDEADHSFPSADPLPMSDGVQIALDDNQHVFGDGEDDDAFAAAPFDTTEAPLLHPSQSGPVSLGTKNAVHLLREHFAPQHLQGATEPPTPSKRVKGEAQFTDLCPEARTSRADATKMFFELLVLGTKDAIKVEQDAKVLGGPIRVRGKRGLWGDWAEMGAGGEIASQALQEQQLGLVEQEA